MTIVLAGLVPGHDTELAVTDKLPVLKLLATFNNMVALPCPFAIVVPAGLVQLKVAPACGFTTEYCTVELQIFVVGPFTATGCKGTPDVTVLHLVVLTPQALVAATHTELAPENPAGKFTVIDGVLAPVAIVAPAGTVQL